MGLGTYNPAQFAQLESQAVQGIASGVSGGLGEIAQGVGGVVQEQKKQKSELSEAIQSRNVLMRLIREAEKLDPSVSKSLRGMGGRAAGDVIPPPPRKGGDLAKYLSAINNGIDGLASALVRNPKIDARALDDAMMLPGWSKSARETFGLSQGVNKKREAVAKEQALGQASRDVAGGRGPAQPVAETGQAPAAGLGPEQAGPAPLGGQAPTATDPRTSSPLPQGPSVLDADTGQAQPLSQPPESKEQFLGDFAERQAQDPSLAGITGQQALGTPAGAQFRPEKELEAESLKVKREARITEDAQTRSQQRQQRLGQQERQLSATVLKAKKGNKTVGDAMDGLFKSINKSMKEVDKSISAQEKIVRETAAGWGDDHAKTKKEEQDLQAIEEELKAAEDARVYVVNKYSADLTSGKVDLAISMAKDEIQKGVYQGIGAIFQKLRAGGGLGPQPAPAADPAAPATSPDAPNLRQKYNY